MQHINSVIFASKEYDAQIRCPCQLVGVIDTHLASIETNLPIVTNHPTTSPVLGGSSHLVCD